MTLNTSTHKNILVKTLKDIFSDATIAPFLGFKGGTAAVLFYGLDRFSVDLDFDLLEASKEDFIFDRVKMILEQHGTLKVVERNGHNLFYLLSYEGKEKTAQNVKVEINRRNFGSAFEVKSYLGISMNVMVKEDMFAHKLVAMVERIGRTNRDVYDVYFFLAHGWSIRKELVEKRTNRSYKDFLTHAISLLEKLNQKDILSGLGELLTEKQKIWVKSSLKSETVFLLRLALENEK